MLEYFNITKYKLVFISLLLGTTLTMDDCPSLPEETNKIKNIPYYTVLGSLMWL